MDLVKKINDVANTYNTSFSEVEGLYNAVIRRNWTRNIFSNNFLLSFKDYVNNERREESLKIVKRYYRRFK